MSRQDQIAAAIRDNQEVIDAIAAAGDHAGGHYHYIERAMLYQARALEDIAAAIDDVVRGDGVLRVQT